MNTYPACRKHGSSLRVLSPVIVVFAAFAAFAAATTVHAEDIVCEPGDMPVEVTLKDLFGIWALPFAQEGFEEDNFAGAFLVEVKRKGSATSSSPGWM